MHKNKHGNMSRPVLSPYDGRSMGETRKCADCGNVALSQEGIARDIEVLQALEQRYEHSIGFCVKLNRQPVRYFCRL